MNSKAVMLTTKDNPYDPFDEYEDWLFFDEGKGYYTNAYLGRIVITSDELSETDQELAIEQAIDEIVELDLLDLYKKVER